MELIKNFLRKLLSRYVVLSDVEGARNWITTTSKGHTDLVNWRFLNKCPEEELEGHLFLLFL